MFFHVFLDEWQDDISALHNASAEDDHFRVVGVNHRDCVNRPNVQTMLLNCPRDSIFASGCGEERLKIEFPSSGQTGFVKSRCFSYYLWQ